MPSTTLVISYYSLLDATGSIATDDEGILWFLVHACAWIVGFKAAFYHIRVGPIAVGLMDYY